MWSQNCEGIRRVYVPDGAQNGGAEDDVDDWVGDTVEWCQTLNEHRHGVLVLPSGG